jgi:uncharacterized membrane protein YozB (DUF420 family)
MNDELIFGLIGMALWFFFSYTGVLFKADKQGDSDESMQWHINVVQNALLVISVFLVVYGVVVLLN